MTPTPPKPEAPKTPEAIAAENLDATAQAAKSKVIESAREAFNKSFGTSAFERLQVWKWPTNSLLFIKNFLVELATVKEEKAETKDEASSDIAKLATSADPALMAEGLTEEMDKEAHFDQDEKEAVGMMTEDVLEAARATGCPGKAIQLIADVQEDSEKEEKDQKPKEVSEEQIRLVFSMGMFTLVRLKMRFNNDQGKMEEFLAKVEKASGKSAKFRKLSKYLALHFKTMFKVSEERIPTLLMVDSLGNLANFALLKFGRKDKVAGALDIILPELFPSSVKHKGLPMLRDFFKQLMAEKKYPGPAKIAELTFLLEESDLRDCAKKMGGAQVVQLASVRESAERKAKAKADAAKKPKKGADPKDPKDKKDKPDQKQKLRLVPHTETGLAAAEDPAQTAEAKAEAERKAAEELADKQRRLAA